MKANFKCPKCKKMIVVGKKLHARYTCPNCHFSMLITREDKLAGTKSLKPNHIRQYIILKQFSKYDLLFHIENQNQMGPIQGEG